MPERISPIQLVLPNRVLTDDEHNIIQKLAFDVKERIYTLREVDIYGMHASTIMTVAQKTIPRDQNVDKQLKALFELIENEQFTKARSMLNAMQADFGDNLPDLARASSMIDFLSSSE